MIGQLLLVMLVGSMIQMVLPFLSQAMVDQGINGRNLNVITLILLAQLGFFIATLSIDYIRSWIMLHMNSRIDIQLIADFLIKLTAMPLQFFDSRMTGDILQRIGDHGRIKNFLLSNSMRIVFSLINFVVSEVMITTCLHNHSMRIGDIGGTGEFMPDGYRNRYYIKGVGTNNGTMRWRLPFTMEEVEALGTRNMLFHPIK